MKRICVRLLIFVCFHAILAIKMSQMDPFNRFNPTLKLNVLYLLSCQRKVLKISKG